MPALQPHEMRRRASAARVARLATIDPDGRPNLVPFVFVLEGETIYSLVDDKPKRSTRLQRLRNIERDPRVTVLIDRYDDDWQRLWWVRLRGRGRVVEEGLERNRAARSLGVKYPQYADAPPDARLLAIDVEDWTGWSYA